MNYPQKLQAGENVFPVTYEASFKKTSSVRIKKNAVRIVLSRFLQGRKRDETIEKFLGWASKRLAKVSKVDFVSPIYEDGGRIVTHNKVYELVVDVVVSDRARARISEGNFLKIKIPAIWTVKDSQEKIKDLAEKLIIKDQTPYLKEVLKELNEVYFQLEFNGCRFKRMESRFGSCSTKRNINIAYRLLFAPREVFRYVCVHELAHLKEFNHSARFWDLVESAMPNYKESEKWLRNSGFMLG